MTMLWLKLRLSLLNFDLIEKQTLAHDWLEISDQWSKMCIHLLLLSLRLILHVLQQSYNRTYIPQTCLQLSKVSLLQRCLVEGEMSCWRRDVLLKERCLLNTEVLRIVVEALFPDWATICVPWISVPKGRLQIKCIWHRLSYSKKLFSKTFHVRMPQSTWNYLKVEF